MHVTTGYSEIIWLKPFFDRISEKTKTMSTSVRLSNPAQYVIGSIGPDASHGEDELGQSDQASCLGDSIADGGVLKFMVHPPLTMPFFDAAAFRGRLRIYSTYHLALKPY